MPVFQTTLAELFRGLDSKQTEGSASDDWHNDGNLGHLESDSENGGPADWYGGDDSEGGGSDPEFVDDQDSESSDEHDEDLSASSAKKSSAKKRITLTFKSARREYIIPHMQPIKERSSPLEHQITLTSL